MTKIKAIISGKAKGLADQVTIDPAFGCKNRCLGCYGFKSSQRGEQYHTVIEREFDRGTLIRSIKKVKEKGYEYGRVGKHCDPGDHFVGLTSILRVAEEESFRCVVVSKSITYNPMISYLIQGGDHTLHISLGPPTSEVRDEYTRLRIAEEYIKDGAHDTYIRLTKDVTREVDMISKIALRDFRCIVTPMRYQSKDLIEEDGADINNFSFKTGYWRPNFIHNTWIRYMRHACGEVGEEQFCCNCLI